MAFIIDNSPTAVADVENAPSSAPTLDQSTATRLRRGNLIAAVVHLASSLVFLAIATDFELPITASYPVEDPALLEGTPPTEILTTVTIGYGVAAFSLLSAFFHFMVATVARKTYERGVSREQNPFRWIEYSFSSTLMIVLITMLLGDYDIGALVGVAGANVSMILFGWLMERQNGPDGPTDWYPFVFGCLAGLVPWIVIVTYFQGALGNADEAVPAWVWAIIVSVFVLFNCFAVNQFLQYRRIGAWRRYVFGEGTYIVLSLVAKTALMWQVYFGTVR